MGAAIRRHYQLLDEAIARHGGIRPQEQGEGDSVVAAFARACDALAAARDIQRAFCCERWPQGASLTLRIALHTAAAQLRDEVNYFGPAVNRCARLRAIGRAARSGCRKRRRLWLPIRFRHVVTFLSGPGDNRSVRGTSWSARRSQRRDAADG
jgi:hypothetical protein